MIFTADDAVGVGVYGESTSITNAPAAKSRIMSERRSNPSDMSPRCHKSDDGVNQLRSQDVSCIADSNCSNEPLTRGDDVKE